MGNMRRGWFAQDASSKNLTNTETMPNRSFSILPPSLPTATLTKRSASNLLSSPSGKKKPKLMKNTGSRRIGYVLVISTPSWAFLRQVDKGFQEKRNRKLLRIRSSLLIDSCLIAKYRSEEHPERGGNAAREISATCDTRFPREKYWLGGLGRISILLVRWNKFRRLVAENSRLCYRHHRWYRCI